MRAMSLPLQWVCVHDFTSDLAGTLQVYVGQSLIQDERDSSRHCGWICLLDPVGGLRGWVPEDRVIKVLSDFSVPQEVTDWASSNSDDQIDVYRLKEGDGLIQIEPRLQSLIHPVKRSKFLEEIWNRKVMVVTGTEVHKRLSPSFQASFLGFDTEQLLKYSPQANVWTVDKVSGKLSQQDMPNADAARRFHRGKSSAVYAKAPLQAEMEYIKAIAEELGLAGTESELPGEIEIFVCRGGHNTAMHFDYMHNFTVQIQGVKRWKLRATTATDPVDNFSLHREDKRIPRTQSKVHGLYSDVAISDGKQRTSYHVHDKSLVSKLSHPSSIPLRRNRRCRKGRFSHTWKRHVLSSGMVP